jgi:hypothetical protein
VFFFPDGPNERSWAALCLQSRNLTIGINTNGALCTLRQWQLKRASCLQPSSPWTWELHQLVLGSPAKAGQESGDGDGTEPRAKRPRADGGPTGVSAVDQAAVDAMPAFQQTPPRVPRPPVGDWADSKSWTHGSLHALRGGGRRAGPPWHPSGRAAVLHPNDARGGARCMVWVVVAAAEADAAGGEKAAAHFEVAALGAEGSFEQLGVFVEWTVSGLWRARLDVSARALCEGESSGGGKGASSNGGGGNEDAGSSGGSGEGGAGEGARGGGSGSSDGVSSGRESDSARIVSGNRGQYPDIKFVDAALYPKPPPHWKPPRTISAAEAAAEASVRDEERRVELAQRKAERLRRVAVDSQKHLEEQCALFASRNGHRKSQQHDVDREELKQANNTRQEAAFRAEQEALPPEERSCTRTSYLHGRGDSAQQQPVYPLVGDRYREAKNDYHDLKRVVQAQEKHQPWFQGARTQAQKEHQLWLQRQRTHPSPLQQRQMQLQQQQQQQQRMQHLRQQQQFHWLHWQQHQQHQQRHQAHWSPWQPQQLQHWQQTRPPLQQGELAQQLQDAQRAAQQREARQSTGAGSRSSASSSRSARPLPQVLLTRPSSARNAQENDNGNV